MIWCFIDIPTVHCAKNNFREVLINCVSFKIPLQAAKEWLQTGQTVSQVFLVKNILLSKNTSKSIESSSTLSLHCQWQFMSKESVRKVIAVPKSMRWSRKNHLLASLLASNSAIFENFAYDPSRKRWAPEFAFWRMHSTSFGQKNWMGFPKSLFLTV